MALDTGPWLMIMNGAQGLLEVSAVDPTGRVTGTMFGVAFQGFWSEREQKLTVIRRVASSIDTLQVIRGYKLSNAPGPTVTSMAGSFEGFSGTGADAARVVYGWRAVFAG